MQPDRTPENLASFRLHQARECLQTAEVNIAAGLFKASAKRSYYCIFHSMRAVMALERFDSKKHSGVISAFRQRYIKTGIFPAELSDIIEKAFDIRNESDYEDYYIVSKEKVAVQLEKAKTFLSAKENYFYLLPNIIFTIKFTVFMRGRYAINLSFLWNYHKNVC